MRIDRLTGTLALLLGYANTHSVSKNAVASQILEHTLKAAAPKLETDALTTKVKHIIDLLT